MEQDSFGFYEKEYYMLSNFSSFAIEWNGKFWMTSEHAYQASKFLDESIQEEIRNARSAHDSKKIAKKYPDKKREDWEQVKLSVMEDILRAKLAQHPYIKEKLIESGSAFLVEDSPKDDYWGWGPNRDGQNHLGKIWMKLREEMEGKQI